MNTHDDRATRHRPGRRAWLLAVAATVLLLGLGAVPAVPAGAVAGATLASGGTLTAGQTLTSNDGRFVVAMQTDGNFVLYAEGTPVWHSGTAGAPGAFVVMQPDGNMVVYTGGGQAVWSSGTFRAAGSRAVLQDDGNFVVYTISDFPAWQSGTAGVLDPALDVLGPGESLSAEEGLVSQSLDFLAVMQGDGNLVLYDYEGTVGWQSGTFGNPGALAVMQTDGNLVVYTADGRARWQSGTAGNTGAFAVMQDDGNFVVYSAAGRPRWQSGTAV